MFDIIARRVALPLQYGWRMKITTDHPFISITINDLVRTVGGAAPSRKASDPARSRAQRSCGCAGHAGACACARG